MSSWLDTPQSTRSPIIDGLHPVPESTLHPVNDTTLEVVPSGHKAPEVYYHQTGEDGRGLNEKRDETRAKSRRRLLIIIAVLLVILIITAAVVGGVLGSRSGKESSDDEQTSDKSNPDASPSASPTATSLLPTPSSIAPLSPLAVAPVYDYNAERYYFHFVFKSQNGKLHYVMYDTTLHAPGSDLPAYWGVPKPLEPESEPARNSTISIASQESIMTLFYTDERRRMLDLSYDSTRDAPSEALARTDNVDKPELFALAGSDVGAYGTWALYQGTDCTLLLYEGIRACEGNSTDGAQLRLQLKALCGTRLAVVPLTTSAEDASIGIIALFYQDEGGKMVATPLHEDLYNKPKTYQRPQIPKGSWTLNGFPNMHLAKDTSFTAFAKKRGGGGNSVSSQAVSIYLLYQDKDSGDIKQLSLEDGSSWKESSPEALAGADVGTTITCVSMAGRTCRSDDWQNIETTPAIALGEHLQRCYFWRLGLVVEVQLREGEWVELGYVNPP